MAEITHDHEKEEARLNALLAKRQNTLLTVWPKLLMAVILIVVVVGVYTYAQNAQKKAEEGVWRAIAEANLQNDPATLPARLETIIQENPSTNATFFANIEIMRGRFDAGEIPEAKTAAERFLKNYPDNYFAPQIRMEYARLLEYENKWGEAREEYKVIMKEGKNYLQPEAHLGNARCLELEGRNVDAKIAYLSIREAAVEHLWPLRAVQTANLRLLALEHSVLSVQAAPVNIKSDEVEIATPEVKPAGDETTVEPTTTEEVK